MEFDPLSKRIIGCALEVHRELGPGLLESVYEECLARELAGQEIAFRRQAELPIVYKGLSALCFDPSFDPTSCASCLCGERI